MLGSIAQVWGSMNIGDLDVWVIHTRVNHHVDSRYSRALELARKYKSKVRPHWAVSLK